MGIVGERRRKGGREKGREKRDQEKRGREKGKHEKVRFRPKSVGVFDATLAEPTPSTLMIHIPIRPFVPVSTRRGEGGLQERERRTPESAAVT